MPIQESQDSERVVRKIEPVIKKEKSRKIRIVPNEVNRGTSFSISEQTELFKKPCPRKRGRKKNSRQKLADVDMVGVAVGAERSAKRKRDRVDYKRYYEGRKKKFGWGLASDKVTKEQLWERSKLKQQSFLRNSCPLCKSRFRMRYRLNEHIKKHSCACKHCGKVYESAFQRSDHRWNCNVRLKSANIKKEKHPCNFNTSLAQPLWTRPVSDISSPHQIEVSTRSALFARGPIPYAFQSASKFALPSFDLEFWPSKIKQPLCPVENDKFSANLQRGDPAESLFGSENISERPSSTLDKEIKSLLFTDKLDILVDF